MFRRGAGVIAAVRVAAARVTSPAAAAMPRLRPSSVPTAWRTSGWQQSAGLSMLTRRAARRGGWRRGGGGGGGGEGDPMLLLYGLIGANVGVFVLWRTSDPVFMQKHFTLSSWSLTSRPHTLLTHMFSHYDGFHLLANMVTLYFFGSTLAPLLGAVRFATLYFTGGLVSAGTHLAVGPRTPILGASGAVNAVVMSNIVLFPKSTILLYMVIPVPAALVGIGFVALDAYGALRERQSGTGSGIAHLAHLGGAGVGLVAGVLLRRGFRM